jgi:hypothetical protein
MLPLTLLSASPGNFIAAGQAARLGSEPEHAAAQPPGARQLALAGRSLGLHASSGLRLSHAFMYVAVLIRDVEPAIEGPACAL